MGDQLDLEVELVACAGRCPGCGRASLTIKERPIVRVRDLPLAGRPTAQAAALVRAGTNRR